MKKSRKFYGLLAGVLTTVMMFGMFPGTALAAPEDALIPGDSENTDFTEAEPEYGDWQEDLADPEVAYELYIAGTQVTSLNKDSIANFPGVEISGEGFITFDPSTNTLKMKNTVIYGNPATYKIGCAINYNGTEDFKIEVEGTCIVTDYLYDTSESPVRENNSAAIFVGAVYNEKDNTNANLDVVIAKGGALGLLSSKAQGYLAATSGGIIMRGDGNVTLGGAGLLVINSERAIFSVGVYCNGIATFNDSLSTTIINFAPSEEFPVYAVYSIYAREFVLNGGKVNLAPGETSAVNCGIAVSNATVNGGDLIIGNRKTESSVGLSAGEGFAINGGTVEISVDSETTTGVALSQAPVLAEGIKAAGSVNSDGSHPVNFNPDDVQTYRWFKAPCEIKPVTEIFDDVKEGAWYVTAIQYVYDKGIMVGKGSTFGVGKSLKREEFVQTLYSMSGKPEISPEAENPFSDVSNKPGYPRDAILWANQHGIAKGNADGTFGVGKDIQRQAVASILYQYAKYIGVATDYDDAALDKFSDKDKVQGWAAEAMKWAVTKGIISGKGNEKTGYRLDPAGKTTREECAAMLKKIDEMPRLK